MRGKPVTRYGLARPLRITPADAGKTRRTAADYTSNRDHPRGCGENRKGLFLGVLSKGSPPRMRGKLFILLHGQAIIRITPADAGKTRGAVSSGGDKQDHPRGCGENPQMPPEARRLWGSPTRMRGKLAEYNPAIITAGITPADAGKTGGDVQVWVIVWDHPRGCGENYLR